VPTANGVGRECRWGWVEWVRRLLPRTNKIGHVMIIWNPANRTTIEVSINTSPVGEERLRKKNVRLIACRARCAPSCRNANSAAQQDLGDLFTSCRNEHS
jgi:hypothetical protein